MATTLKHRLTHSDRNKRHQSREANKNHQFHHCLHTKKILS